MTNISETFVFLLNFTLIALASWQIGKLFVRLGLPKISGFLFTGLLAGPFVLGLAGEEAVESLRFIEEISLAYIAFAAGSELYLPEIRGRLRSIGWVTAGLVVVTLTLGTLVIFVLADWIPFMETFGPSGRFGVSLLAASIMVARSPSVAIAIINELRAKGPFTQIALGVTVISDVLVIVLFAISADIADALLTDVRINFGLLLLLLVELLLSLALGYLLGRLLQLLLSFSWRTEVKTAVVLALGFGVFLFSGFVRDYTHDNLPFELLLEPLLICMIGSFFVNNFSRYRLEFAKILHEIGPLVYVAFFTLVGEGLKLDILAQVWPIALVLFAVRGLSIFIGSFAGGVVAGEPMTNNRVKWMVFVTQAGVALGLAQEVSVSFPGWGDAFATTIIAAVVLNEMVGPVLFKFAINYVGEARTRGDTAEFDGVRDVIIFGLKAESIALARQLEWHDWQVKIADLHTEQLPKKLERVQDDGVTIVTVPDISLSSLQKLDAAQADGMVMLLSDDENYRLCEMVYEHFGTETIVVRLNERENRARFQELGTLIVEPQTAVVSLLEHFVRSPVGTSLLLGMDESQDIVDVEVRNAALDGVTLRELRLPLDVLILSVHRDGQTLITHGHTPLHLGDKVTMVGERKQLEEVTLRFDA